MDCPVGERFYDSIERNVMKEEAFKKIRILVVDDQPDNLSILCDYLNMAGFHTFIARNGQSAIRKAAFAKPHLILLDVMMPGLDGFETCRRLKSDPETRDIPVIFMSALSDTNDKIRGFESGAVDYITKPFKQEEVLARLKTHLVIQQQREELVRLNQELSDLNRMKNRFFSIVSHDLKGSFQSILTMSELMVGMTENIEPATDPEQMNDAVISKEQGDSLEKIKYFSRQMYTASQQSHKLMENLLNWARLQTQKIEFEPEPIDLLNAVLSNIFLFQESVRQKKIKLSHDIKPGIRVYADAQATETILRNLISNAVKFTQTGGHIDISAKMDNTFVEVIVSDNGVGIDKDSIRKLFRIDETYKKDGTAGEKGSGLGLILCKEFVEKNSGKIWVKSKKNKGSSFHFTLLRPPDELPEDES